MKKIKYLYCGIDKEMTWCKANEDIAKYEADNGIYTIKDDGIEEIVVEEQSLEERTAALEETLSLLLEGVTE